MEREILMLGPLPERGGLLTPTLCKVFWGEVDGRNGAPVGSDETTENAKTTATETLLSHVQLDSVELIGVERPAKITVAFEIQIKLIDQTR